MAGEVIDRRHQGYDDDGSAQPRRPARLPFLSFEIPSRSLTSAELLIVGWSCTSPCFFRIVLPALLPKAELCFSNGGAASKAPSLFVNLLAGWPRRFSFL